jgi:hypothetical protein
LACLDTTIDLLTVHVGIKRLLHFDVFDNTFWFVGAGGTCMEVCCRADFVWIGVYQREGSRGLRKRLCTTIHCCVDTFARSSNAA